MTLSFENGVTVSDGGAFRFDLDLTVFDSVGTEIETSKYLNWCGLLNSENWGDWDLYFELFDATGEIALPFVPLATTALRSS